jgi:hypothetical protein
MLLLHAVSALLCRMEQALGINSAAAGQRGRLRSSSSRADARQQRAKELLGPLQLPLQPRREAAAAAAAAAVAAGSAANTNTNSSSSSQADLDDVIKLLQVWCLPVTSFFLTLLCSSPNCQGIAAC